MKVSRREVRTGSTWTWICQESRKAVSTLSMRRAHRPDHHLMRLRIVLQAHGDVLGHQPPQRRLHLLLIATSGGVQRYGEQRLGQQPGLDERWLRLLDSVSEVSAAASLDTRTRSPAIAYGFGLASSPSGAESGPTLSSSLS